MPFESGKDLFIANRIPLEEDISLAGVFLENLLYALCLIVGVSKRAVKPKRACISVSNWLEVAGHVHLFSAAKVAVELLQSRIDSIPCVSLVPGNLALKFGRVKETFPKSVPLGFLSSVSSEKQVSGARNCPSPK